MGLHLVENQVLQLPGYFYKCVQAILGTDYWIEILEVCCDLQVCLGTGMNRAGSKSSLQEDPGCGKWVQTELPFHLHFIPLLTDIQEAIYKEKERQKSTIMAEKKSKISKEKKSLFLLKKQLWIKSKMLNTTTLGL